MKFNYQLDSFEKVSYNQWLTQVEKQLGKPISSLYSKLYEDIEIKPLYLNENKEFNPNNQNKTKLYNENEFQYTQVLYFSDHLKDGIDAINEIAFIVYQVLNEYEKGNKSILIVSGINIEFYVAIAKFRALRFLLDAILHNLNINDINFKILATVTHFNKSTLDKENNIIRQTGEMISAVLGNADFIQPLPYNLDFNDKFTTRISQNIFHIIEKETYLTSILDAVKGSYFFESLTNDFILKAFETLNKFSDLDEESLFSEIEKLKKEKYNQRVEKYKSRKEKLIGVNIYSNNNDNSGRINHLGISKYFEEFRKQAIDYQNKNSILPKLYIATFGKLSEIKPRIDFISDFFNCGGFECEVSNQFETIEDAITMIDIKSPKVCMILSTDEIYKEIVPELTFNLKKLNPDINLYLAGKPVDDFERYKKIGVDNFIHIFSNIHEELEKIWQIYS
jgi:methylmalonyl-CoA mutase